MTIQDLIDFHTTGAAACEAFAVTPAAGDAKYKDITKHYTKRAKWHRDAVALLSAQHQGEPVAWRHTMHFEEGCGRRFELTGSAEPPFGKPDVDYDKNCRVTCEPLFAEQRAPVAVVMPERKCPSEYRDSSYTQTCMAGEYNRALAEVARLNGVKP